LIYLDNAASTRVSEEALAAATKAMLEHYGNPSSNHAVGSAAANLLNDSREKVAAAMGVNPSDLYFTSGGTEADNLAVISGAYANRKAGKHIIISATEHDAVRKSAQHLKSEGYEVTELLPDKSGVIPFDTFAAALREDTSLVSIMTVNNETGAINPVEEYIAEIKRRGLGTLFHTDAVQALCKVELPVSADMISVSGHKIHAPKGVGALYVRPGLKLRPRAVGGSHESGLRAGTENVPAIAGFGVAAEAGTRNKRANYDYVKALRETLITELKNRISEIVFIGGGSPYILSLSLPGYRSETLMTCLAEYGICVARSSACKKGARSHVLDAMRLPDSIIDGALRVSFSEFNTNQEVIQFAEALEAISKRLYHK